MEATLLTILAFLGALALFIYGMKVMSEGSQKLLGQPLRDFLKKATSSPVAGVFTGLSTSFLIHSSSATSVMLVSFVNAGFIRIRQAMGVIMGANIGTTLTAALIMILGFTSFRITALGLPLLAVALPITLSRGDHWRSLGEFLIGLALLLLGMELLQKLFEWGDSPFFRNLSALMEMGGWSKLLFLLLGVGITYLLQSSAATIALSLTFAGSGQIPFALALVLVLGANIGTTITANLAAGSANINGKRTAFIHFLFNLFGLLWVIPFFDPLLQGLDAALMSVGLPSPLHHANALTWGVILFHFLFNTVNSIVLVPFSAPLSRWIESLIPPSGIKEQRERLEYIDPGLWGTPELSLIEARKEIGKFGEIVQHMNGYVRSLIQKPEPEDQADLLKKVRKYEEITDRIEMEVADYLSRISRDELSMDSSLRIRGMMSIVNDLERIGDILYQMSQHLERKAKENPGTARRAYDHVRPPGRSFCDHEREP
ncbi:MAG: Na/Pi cotransporter family protein [Flavobacteriales bacterium]